MDITHVEDYKVVERGNSEDFEHAVKALLKDGYALAGQPLIAVMSAPIAGDSDAFLSYTQVLVKPSPSVVVI